MYVKCMTHDPFMYVYSVFLSFAFPLPKEHHGGQVARAAPAAHSGQGDLRAQGPVTETDNGSSAKRWDVQLKWRETTWKIWKWREVNQKKEQLCCLFLVYNRCVESVVFEAEDSHSSVENRWTGGGYSSVSSVLKTEICLIVYGTWVVELTVAVGRPLGCGIGCLCRYTMFRGITGQQHIGPCGLGSDANGNWDGGVCECFWELPASKNVMMSMEPNQEVYGNPNQPLVKMNAKPGIWKCCFSWFFFSEEELDLKNKLKQMEVCLTERPFTFRKMTKKVYPSFLCSLPENVFFWVETQQILCGLGTKRMHRLDQAELRAREAAPVVFQDSIWRRYGGTLRIIVFLRFPTWIVQHICEALARKWALLLWRTCT